MRERVVGIETEYALIYHPGRRERQRPQNLSLYTRFETALRSRVRSLPNAFSPLRAKLGRFLENGGTFHYEATVEHYEHGLIEMASPECRDPLTLLCHEKAKDALIEELAAEVNAELGYSGYTGKLRIGKNNVDSQGHSFGSHENYWVDDPLPPARRRLFALLFGPLWLVSLPVIGFVIGLQIALVLALFAVVFAIVLASLALPWFRGVWARRWLARAQRAQRFLQTDHIEIARRLQPLLLPLHALIALHGWVYDRFHFRRIRELSTAFLVTRCVYAGAGAVAFDGAVPFRISQRAPFICTHTRICVDGKRRPIFETRDLFFRPWSALGRRRRLQLMLGDSNLCDTALFLRVGATCLVLEAIETGEPFEWPILSEPLAALQTVSDDVELAARLEMVGGEPQSALAIQRRYVEAVRALLPAETLRSGWRRQVLQEWDRALEDLVRDPDSLADRVDWIAKRALLRAEVPSNADWEALRERGAELLRVDADDEEDARLRELAYRVWRTDLRYHELGARGGFRKLERRGRVASLVSEPAVERARVSPPTDTRAYARGAAIRWAADQALSGAAAWHRVRLGKLDWRWFRDPLDPRDQRAPERADPTRDLS